MKNIKRVSLYLLIVVFLAAGNNSMAQEKEDRGKTAKEMNKAADQEKQKGREKVKEAEEAADNEADRVKDATEREASQVKDGNEREADRVKESAEREADRVKESAEREADRVKEAAEREADRVKDAREEGRKDRQIRQVKDQEDNQGQGNAYGRNKGGLQGRDFGQARAEQARMQRQAREAELDTHILDGEERVARSRERIRVAREELEKEKTGRRISESDYQLKKEKIDNAEKAVDELDQKIRNGRNLKGEK